MSNKDHASTVLALDKYQGRPGAASCPIDDSHGRLTVHGSGSFLICGVCRRDQPVGIAVDNDMITAALNYVEADRNRVIVPTMSSTIKGITRDLGSRR